jgi:hypothetical protein
MTEEKAADQSTTSENEALVDATIEEVDSDGS